MRVVIVDKSLRAGRKLATAVEQVHGAADVLVYDEPQAALAGIAEHRPDVVIVGASLGAIDGAHFVEQAHSLDQAGAGKFVGVVDNPSPEWSTRFIDAGARLVVQRPLDSVAVRMALRHAAGGVPG